MNQKATATAIDLSIQLLLTLINSKANAQVVSDIVAKRITEGRKGWTPEELKIVSDMSDAARSEAVDAVNQLP